MRFCSMGTVKRLSAWITLQALLVIPAESADHLRGQPPTESAIAAGLEESLLAQPMGVDVLTEPLSAERVKELLPHPTTLAVVVGKETLMDQHLSPWLIAAQGRPVNVIGVHEDWLVGDAAVRLVALDRKSGRLVEFPADRRRPVPLHHAFIVELPQSVEVKKHGELTFHLLRAGVDVVNPGGPYGRERADDKAWLRLNGRDVPETVLIQRGAELSKSVAELSRLADRSQRGIVIQPRANTTLGQGVQWFAPDNRKGASDYLQRLLLLSDALVSEYRGDVTYQGRAVVLRFNVAAGEATSATAVVAPEGEKIASLGRGGAVEPLGKALSGLRGPGGPVAVTKEIWGQLRETARDAAVATGLNIAGIDMVLDADGQGGLRGVVLEANVRPGLLMSGERVEFSEDGSIKSFAAAPAGDAFWSLLLSRGPSSAGLEELPAAADPTSEAFAPEQYVVSSPAAASPQGEEVLPLETADPVHVRQLVQAGKRVVLSPRMNRVGEQLWDKQAHRDELQSLYRLYYDIAEGRSALTSTAIERVVELLNHPAQAVAAAARDVIVKARVHGLAPTVKELVQKYKQADAASAGPYAAHYLKEALTARLDLAHRMELGSPETSVFAGKMNEDRMHEIHAQLQQWVDPKSRLSLLTGSGQRMAAPIGLVDAGFQAGGFPPQERMVDIGSQPHDVVKVLFGLVAKLFAENMPRWRAELGRDEQERGMPAEWTVAIGMDPRSTGPAILQVAARIFRKAGVQVKFIGITSAPEAAARALLSDPKEHVLACYEITPSHIAQGFQGTKLMLWTGQIMPWAKAEEFNDRIREAARDFNQVRQVIEWLQQDPEMDAQIAEILRQMPAEYAVSKAMYHQYLMQVFTGTTKTGPELEAEVARLAAELRQLGVTIVLDTNGGARIPDLPVYDKVFGGYIVIGANAAEFAHALPPGEISARGLMEFGRRIAPAFDEEKICCLWVNPDPDGDRKGIVYRAPSGEFLYLDPQAGYLLDVLNHVLSAQESKIPGVGVVGNEATTIVAKILEQRLGYRLLITETGEANVVQGMNRLLADLQTEQGGDRSKVVVLGGEGSAAATIAGDVQVRDMIQGVVSMVNFMRKRERVERLIELLVDGSGERTRLLEEVDSWYQPGQLQYLLYHIVHEVLPAMRNTDPGYDTEVHQGVGVPNQQPFKDTADRLLAPEGEWVRTLKQETAEVLAEVMGTAVEMGQIRISEPINSVEDYQLFGAGNRTLPDGRQIHDGGYEIQVFYRDAQGREQYLYKLEFRRSKTQVGDTRRMVFNAVTFLPRAQADHLAGRLYDRSRSLWLGFLNDLEVEELMGHVEPTAQDRSLNRFGLPYLATLDDLSRSLNRLLATTREARAVRVERLADPEKPTYSKTDAENIEEQDAAAKGAVARLSELLGQADAPLAELRAVADEVQGTGQVTDPQRQRLAGVLQALTGLPQVPVAAASKGRDDLANAMAQNLVGKAFRWKIVRLMQGLQVAPAPELLARMDRLNQVVEDLQQFVSRGAAAENSKEGTVFSNLVNAKILLSGEAEFAKAGMEEDISLPAGATQGKAVFLTPEVLTPTFLAGLARLRPAPGEQMALLAFAENAYEAREAQKALEAARLGLLEPVVDLQSEYDGDLERAVKEKKRDYGALQIQVVYSFDDLDELGKFLQIPDVSIRAWKEQVTGADLGVQA